MGGRGRLRVVGMVGCALLALTGCRSSSGRGGSGGGGVGTPLPISTLSAAKFHAIGVAVSAPVVTSLESAAQTLNTQPATVQSYFRDVCQHATLITLPGLIAFPSQVPAYEFIFDQVQQNCPSATPDFLDHQRGNVATSVVHSQAFLDQLTGTSSSRVNRFCDGLEQSKDIDSELISAAAEKVGVSETGGKLLEFGVDLMITNCVDLLERISG
jgi:hypothetical protein